MKVPLTVNDFIRRAELLYPDRPGIVDEPDQPAESWGTLTYREVAERAAGDRRRARRARDRRRRARRHGQPQLGAADHGPVRRVRLRPHPRAGQLPPRRRGGRATSSSTPAPGMLLVDPELDDALSGVKCERRYVIGAESRRRAAALRRRAGAVGGRRGRHGDDQLHVGHDGPTEGRAADPPQHLAQRHDVRLAHGRHRPRRLPAHAAAVPLQRLGDALRRHRAWAVSTSCCARSTAPRSCAASSATA